VASHLCRLGFLPIKDRRAASFYLKLPQFPWKVRIADHHNGTRGRADIALDVVITKPRADDPLLMAVEVGVRYIAATRVLRGLVSET
jgi:hypothetical protein